MLKLVLDTNFLALPFNRKVDIYELIAETINEPYELIVLEPCLGELGKISQPSLELAKGKVKIVKVVGEADQAIYDYAVSNKPDVIVCTQDYELRRRVSKAGVRVGSFSNSRLRIS